MGSRNMVRARIMYAAFYVLVTGSSAVWVGYLQSGIVTIHLILHKNLDKVQRLL